MVAGSNAVVTCQAPSAVSRLTGLSILQGPLPPRLPARGLTYVGLSWNGQQFGPQAPADPSAAAAAAAVSSFWFHSPVTVTAVAPQVCGLDL